MDELVIQIEINDKNLEQMEIKNLKGMLIGNYCKNTTSLSMFKIHVTWKRCWINLLWNMIVTLQFRNVPNSIVIIKRRLSADAVPWMPQLYVMISPLLKIRSIYSYCNTAFNVICDKPFWMPNFTQRAIELMKLHAIWASKDIVLSKITPRFLIDLQNSKFPPPIRTREMVTKLILETWCFEPINQYFEETFSLRPRCCDQPLNRIRSSLCRCRFISCKLRLPKSDWISMAVISAASLFSLLVFLQWTKLRKCNPQWLLCYKRRWLISIVRINVDFSTFYEFVMIDDYLAQNMQKNE